MTTFGLNNGLNTTPERLAAVHDEVLAQVVPFSEDGGLEVVNIAMGSCPGLPVHNAPHCIIQRISIRS